MPTISQGQFSGSQNDNSSFCRHAAVVATCWPAHLLQDINPLLA